mgnify:CR=1 FL=1
MPRSGHKTKKDVVQLKVWISKELNKRFREMIALKYKTFEKGLLSWEVEQALMNWVALHYSEHTDAQIPEPNPPANVFKVFQQVKDWIEKQYDVGLEKGAHVSKVILERAIAAVRGGDRRTIRKWMKLFREFELIKPLTPGVWELL